MLSWRGCLNLFIFKQEKRFAFPRFYFIGDDDLLEILGQSTNPLVIQSHLKKLFAGKNDKESKNCIVGMDQKHHLV